MTPKSTPAANNPSAYHISQNKVEYNPQRKSNFILVIDFENDLPRVGSDEGTTDASSIISADEAQKQVVLFLKSCDTPNVSLGEMSVDRGNSVIKFAGKPTFSDISFVAYDFIGANIKDTLLAWQNLAYNSKYDYIGNARGYKKHCQLIQQTPNGTMVRYWDIEGAWPKNVEPGDYDYSSEDQQDVSCTLAIDWAEMHTPEDFTV